MTLKKLFYGILIIVLLIGGVVLFYLFNTWKKTLPTQFQPKPETLQQIEITQPKLTFNISGCGHQKEREYIKTRESKEEKVDFEITDNRIKLTHHLNYVCCAKIKVNWELEKNPAHNILKIKEKNEGEMCRCICDYVVDINIENLEKGKYLLQIFGVEFQENPAELLWEKEIEIPQGSIKKENKFCKNLCGDGICQEIVCMAVGCPCPETPETCPQDCPLQ